MDLLVSAHGSLEVGLGSTSSQPDPIKTVPVSPELGKFRDIRHDIYRAPRSVDSNQPVELNIRATGAYLTDRKSAKPGELRQLLISCGNRKVARVSRFASR